MLITWRDLRTDPNAQDGPDGQMQQVQVGSDVFLVPGLTHCGAPKVRWRPGLLVTKEVVCMRVLNRGMSR